MELDVATKEDIERMLDRKVSEAIDDLKYEIQQIGKPEYIDREGAARHLGYKSLDSVTRWIKEYDVHYFYNGNKIMINRKELLDSIRNR